MLLDAAPGRDPARELVETELRRREYDVARPSLLARAFGRVLREIGDLLDRAASAAPGGLLGVLALIALLALLVVVVLVRLGPLARTASGPALFDTAPPVSADKHRRRAESAAADGRYADAVRERLRALVRELEQRGALDTRPGRTAGEIAHDAGGALPEAGPDLQQAARLFDEVWYGGRPADPGTYRALVEIDERVSRQRMVLS